MKELEKIIDLYEQLDFSKTKAAVATVVHVEGSSYRQPGAKMLVTDDGRWEGSISGGCLEGDALRKARKIMAEQKPALITYDTMDDGAKLGIGLGCNGIIHIFLEPVVHEDPHNIIMTWKSVLKKNQPEVMGLVVHNAGAIQFRTGQRISFKDIPIESPSLLSLFEDAKRLKKSCYTQVEIHGHPMEFFIEYFHPPIKLFVFGAGPDAIPLTKMACEQGWKVTVTEDCIAHLSPKKFLPSCKLVYSERMHITDNFSFDERSAAVLVSHNFQYDLAVLKQLLNTPVGYIGVMGPLKRFVKLKDSLEVQGVAFSKDDLSRIHAPVGLDIGAESPEEIALSITAEIKAFFSGRNGGSLRERKNPIHERSDLPFVPLFSSNADLTHG